MRVTELRFSRIISSSPIAMPNVASRNATSSIEPVESRIPDSISSVLSSKSSAVPNSKLSTIYARTFDRIELLSTAGPRWMSNSPARLTARLQMLLVPDIEIPQHVFCPLLFAFTTVRLVEIRGRRPLCQTPQAGGRDVEVGHVA